MAKRSTKARERLHQPAAVSDLAEELFNKVQYAQGQAFISDGWSGAHSRAQFFEWVRNRLDWNNEASNKIRAFLRKHDRA
jgi:hypothetical protein